MSFPWSKRKLLLLLIDFCILLSVYAFSALAEYVTVGVHLEFSA